MQRLLSINIQKYSTYKQVEIYILFIKIAFKIKLKRSSDSKLEKEYLNYIFNLNDDNSDFINITKEKYNGHRKAKLLAYYLPQFHQIPLNNDNFGRGFTEWTNVTKMSPQFTGHYQPHLPIDVGFYDLSHDDVMKRQVELAKLYGIYGFCFHYYWFSGGKRLLEKPLFNWLNNKELDLPFCLCWANESWAKVWDKGDKSVLMEQKFSFEDCDIFFKDILPFFNDERYIKINNKPLLVMYNPMLFKKEETTYFVKRIKELCKQNGFNGCYIIGAEVFGNEDSTIFGMDASVEFYPNSFKDLKEIDLSNVYVNKNFKCRVFDMEDAILNHRFMKEVDYPLHKTVFPYWDNSARKAFSGGWVFQSTPRLYKKWLKEVIKYTEEKHPEESCFAFINAWNEWAEGAHLEPDRKFGYAFLQATKEALEEDCL